MEEREHHGYSPCGLLGTPYGAAPGDNPPLPLPRAPSPRSNSNGDLSPSAIPRAKRWQAPVSTAARSVDVCCTVEWGKQCHVTARCGSAARCCCTDRLPDFILYLVSFPFNGQHSFCFALEFISLFLSSKFSFKSFKEFLEKEDKRVLNISSGFCV